MTGKQPFEAVVARYGATVLRVCRAVLGQADADDAWSQTFLSAMKAYPDLPDGANLEAWLVTIAHRKAIDLTRSAARQAVPVARTPDDPKAVRATATACATNPLPIVVPCHRVIYSDGRIGQYRGGADAKRTLLTPEAAR